MVFGGKFKRETWGVESNELMLLATCNANVLSRFFFF